MLPLPVEGWAHSQVCYRHLIRPVVTFVRDHGPVAVERVTQFIANEAPGDLTFASPSRDRADAAVRTLNLLADDVDALVIAEGDVSVPVGVTVVHSTLFGGRKIPPAEEQTAQQQASRRQRTLREWVGRNLFATKWRHGIRQHRQPDIDWMADQIRTFGYVGPPIVTDAELGTIINGGLRAAALSQLGMAVADHSVTMTFQNDRHRLAYVLAAHATPGKTRVPVSLRNAILTAILPRNAGLLRSKGSDVVEPSDDEWLAITGNDFGDEPEPVVIAPKPEMVVVPPRVAVDVAVSDAVLSDKILAAMNPDEWVGYFTMFERLLLDVASTRIGRTMREMAERNVLERRLSPKGHAEYRPRLLTVPEVPAVAPSVAPSVVKRTCPVGRVADRMLSALRHFEYETPGRWINLEDLRGVAKNPYAQATDLKRAGWIEQRPGQVRYIRGAEE